MNVQLIATHHLLWIRYDFFNVLFELIERMGISIMEAFPKTGDVDTQPVVGDKISRWVNGQWITAAMYMADFYQF